MKTLIEDIVGAIQDTTTFSVTIPTDNISESYPVYQPDFSQPYIIVHEIVNQADMLTYTHKEEYSIVTYDIEIYCKQMTIDGVVTPAKKVARILAEEIDTVITSTLGLVRTMSPADAPYEVDTSVSRKILTYEGILDLTNDYIYNRR